MLLYQLVYGPIQNFIVSGIMALCATSAYYDVTEIATRILPNVVLLTIDPDRLTILQMICLLLF